MPAPTDADCRVVANWLLRLAAITRQPNGEHLDDETLGDLASLLAASLPIEPFEMGGGRPLLLAVATGREWFPAYDVIRREVGTWWSAQQPPAPALTGPASDMPTADAKWFERFWSDENIRQTDARLTDPQRRAERCRALSAMRSYAPVAFAAVASSRVGWLDELEDWLVGPQRAIEITPPLRVIEGGAAMSGTLRPILARCGVPADGGRRA